jgi:hypothetical protein
MNDLNTLRLSDVYKMLLESQSLFAQSTMSVDEIQSEISESDAELSRDVDLFNSWQERSRNSMMNKDADSLGKSLVHLRIHAMNISTIFLNLANAIEQLAFTDGNDIEEKRT